MKASELKGTTVITVFEGERIGTVEDVLLHPQQQRLRGLLVRSPRFAGSQVLPANDIKGFGRDAITIESADKLQDRARYAEPDHLVTLEEISGRKVVTTSGNHVGDVQDVDVDPATGRITGYEVAGGLFAKILGRSRTIEASDRTHLGKDLLIVPDEVIPSGEGEHRTSMHEQSLGNDRCWWEKS